MRGEKTVKLKMVFRSFSWEEEQHKLWNVLKNAQADKWKANEEVSHEHSHMLPMEPKKAEAKLTMEF